MKKNLITFLIVASCIISTAVNGDIIWDSPTNISMGEGEPSDPRIVIDSFGNTTAAWIENEVVKSSSLSFGGEWTQPVIISNEQNTASKPKLGVDSAGNVTALWIENTSITITTLPFGGDWNREMQVISDSGASNPTLVVDDANNAVVIWVRNGFIESATRLADKWNPVTVLSSANSNNPHLAIGNSGNAIAVWHTTISGIETIMTSILTLDGNTWDAAKKVFKGTLEYLHDFPKTAIDSQGNATVAWFRYKLVNGNSYQSVQIMTSSLAANGTSWGVPTALSGNGLRKPADLSIKLRIDSNGDVLAVWTNSYDGESFGVESSLKLFGGTWPSFATPQNPSLYSFAIDLASSSGSTLLTNMVWNESSGIQIQSQETDTTNPTVQAWSYVNPITTKNKNGYPQCAMCALEKSFHAVTIWVNFNNKGRYIQASTGTTPIISPPANIKAVQGMDDLGIYKDYFNTITWEASPENDILQYTIFRNGVGFASTDADTLNFIDHNAERDGTVTYGIAALNSFYRQSEIISFTLSSETTEESTAKEKEVFQMEIKKRRV